MSAQPQLRPAAPQPLPAAAPAATRAAWLAVMSVAIGAFALVTTEFLPVGLLPAMAAELRVTEGVAGMMVTIPGLVATLAALLVTAGAGKADRRHVIVGLMGLLALSNLMVALAHSFTLVLLGRALLGVGVGGFWAIGGGLGPRLAPAASAARATAVIFAGISLGTVAGVPAGALIGDLFGWRAAFGAGTALALLVALTQLRLLPALPTKQAVRLDQLPGLLKRHKVRIGMLATFLIFVGQFAAYTYITPFLVQVAGMSAATVSALLLAFGAAGFAGNLVGGWAVARSLRAALIATGLVMGLSALAMALLGAHPAAVAVLAVVWGLAFGAMPIAVQSWMFAATADAMESGGALFVATAQISLASGALVGGAAVDYLGVSSAMWVGGLFALSMALVVRLFGGAEEAPSALRVVRSGH